MTSHRIVITGGGTGGHVFPALAMAEELRARGIEVLYVGTRYGMEAKLVPEKKFPFFTVRTGAVKNQSALKIFKTCFQLLGAIFWAMGFLTRERVEAVIGVGGYVSVPTCVAAFLLRKPIYLQEQNTSVGIANRFLGRLANTVFLGFADGEKYFAKRKCVVTGNPLRPEFSNPDNFPYDPTAQTILVCGGSQGAKAINDAFLDMLPELEKAFPNAQVVHQTGAKDFESVKARYPERFHGRADVQPFIPDMAKRYAAASVVIGRSGALTVSELMQAGRPAILVPYPRRGQNDQTTNAYFLEKKGAGRVVEQGPDFANRLRATFFEVFRPDVLEAMNVNMTKLRRQNALATIGDYMERALKRG